MEAENRKCVMILDEELPAGVLANAAGILGMTLGKQIPEVIGPDVLDKNGREHLGITAYPVPILKADKESSGRSGNSFISRNLQNVWRWIFLMWRKAAGPMTNLSAGPRRQEKRISPIWASASGERKSR